MKHRRKFLVLSTILLMSPLCSSVKFKRDPVLLSAVERETIEAVLEHFFPVEGELPGAKTVGLLAFVEDALLHPSFDKDIRRFVKRGARILHRRTKGRLLKMSYREREKALRSFEGTGLGSGWLSRVMILGLEGLLGDPIYGANKDERGWKVLGVQGGYPRPQVRYLGR